VEAAKKLGIESRMITAGEHKGILDPFKPLTDIEKEHLKTMLQSTHQQFITAVKQGRGDRLKDNPDIFSGLFWTGEDARELGLVDGFLTMEQIAKEVVKAEELVNFTPKKTLLDRLAARTEIMLGNALLNAQTSQGLLY